MRVAYRVAAASMGPAALRVWRVLVWFRDETQAVFPGLAYLGGKANLSVRTTQRALHRLRQLEIVIDRGSVAELTPNGFSTPFHRLVQGREVRGGFEFPDGTLALMRKLGAVASHGGKRAGAGRVKVAASVNQVARSHFSEKRAVPGTSVNQVAWPAPLEVREVKLPKWMPTQPPINDLHESRGALVSTTTVTPYSVTPFGSYNASKARVHFSNDAGNALMMARRPSSPSSGVLGLAGRPASPAANDVGRGLLDAVASLRAELLGQAPRRIIAWGQGGLPPFPEAFETHVKVPGPPRLPERDVETPEEQKQLREEQLEWCAEWYYGVLKSRGITCPRIRMAGQTRGFFEDALEVWLAHDIRPAAWIAWNLDRILGKLPGNARRRFVPRFGTLLSPKTLTENRWMFRESDAAFNPRLVPTKAGERLMQTLNELWVFALRADEAQVRMAVDVAFPEGYAARRREVREKTEKVRQGVLSRIKEFEWVWAIP